MNRVNQSNTFLTLYLLVYASKKGQSIDLGTKDSYDSHQGGIRARVGESIIENKIAQFFVPSTGYFFETVDRLVKFKKIYS